MNLPKELQALLNMILRDLGGQNPVPLPTDISNIDDYLDDLHHQGDQKHWDKRKDVIAGARNDPDFGDLMEALLIAAIDHQNGKPLCLSLFLALEALFPGGDGKDVAKTLAVLLYWSGAGTLDQLLLMDFQILLDILNPPDFKQAQKVRQAASAGSAIMGGCLGEVLNVEDLHFLVHTLVRFVAFPTGGSVQERDAQGAQLVLCIENAVGPDNKKKMPTSEKEIALRIKSMQLFTISLDVLAPNVCSLLNFRYICEAVNHLILGDVQFLDPVIADASCELRPPFVLTAYEIVQGCVINLGGLDQCKNYIRLFYQNHQKNVWGESKIVSVLQVMGENVESLNYIYMIRQILQALRQVQDYYVDYLYLCKAMTRARYVTRDEFGIEVDDGERTNIFSINTDRANRARLAGYTVRFIRETAGNLQLSHNGGWINTIVPVLNNCNVGMMQKNSCLSLLPIYSGEKVALAKACIEGWPIILRLSRIQYVENSEEYRLLGTAVLVYLPDVNSMSYALAGCWDSVTDAQEWGTNDPTILGTQPGICVSAYSICSTQGQLENDVQFRVEDFGQYLNALKGCDIIHLISMCAANHPPFPDQGGLIQNNGVNQFRGDGAFEYEWGTLYGGQFPGFTDTSGQLVLQSPYSFVDMEVVDEHLDMFRLANRYHMQEARYTINGNRRIDEMHFYSLHLYASSFRVEHLRMHTIWQNVNAQSLVGELDVNGILDTFNESTENELTQSRNV